MVPNFTLVSQPEINSRGVPYGNLLCYLIMVVCGLGYIRVRLQIRIPIIATILKPLFCAVLCGAGAFVGYNSTAFITSNNLRTLLAVAIAAGLYLLAVLLSRTITRVDVEMLPVSEYSTNALEQYRLIAYTIKVVCSFERCCQYGV